MKHDSPQRTPAKTSGGSKRARRAGRGAPAGKSSVDADPVMAQAKATQELVASMLHNANKALDFGRDSALDPPSGLTADPASAAVSASTLSEVNVTAKTGDPAMPGGHATDGRLAQARVDGSRQVRRTNQGVAVADNQNSLKAGLRGPNLLEDFVLREKITHFDHERIPKRIVHARGSAAHGYFEACEALTDLTCAAPLAEAGKVTPVFVRFSTVAGERRSVNTARDVRGFAVAGQRVAAMGRGAGGIGCKTFRRLYT